MMLGTQSYEPVSFLLVALLQNAGKNKDFAIPDVNTVIVDGQPMNIFMGL